MNLDADHIVEAAAVITALRDTGFTVEAVHVEDALDLLCYHEQQRGTSLVVSLSTSPTGLLEATTHANPYNTRGGPSPAPGLDGLRAYLDRFLQG